MASLSKQMGAGEKKGGVRWERNEIDGHLLRATVIGAVVLECFLFFVASSVGLPKGKNCVVTTTGWLTYSLLSGYTLSGLLRRPAYSRFWAFRHMYCIAGLWHCFHCQVPADCSNFERKIFYYRRYGAYLNVRRAGASAYWAGPRRGRLVVVVCVVWRRWVWVGLWGGGGVRMYCRFGCCATGMDAGSG
jgi:hypothetical protein